ncbi:terpenoid synthase [Athelia psychrophila]|uniref:Terpene synthase n=1 Tax=Athelia psychrophila TaxID=1759441 RepID=A0A166FF50_9AGAM|nr:terpenoid synthase [Fibularhizoctonia sp. CBS 109695]
MITAGYVAPFPPLSTQPYPPARIHPRWKESYRLHDTWIMKHWPFQTETKRAKLPSTKLAGFIAWAAPYADFDRLVWASRLTGLLILEDDLVNNEDHSTERIAGFKHVAAGNGPLHPRDQAEIAHDLSLQAIKRTCHPRTFAQLTRLTREWWDSNACHHKPDSFADLDSYLAGRATETGIYMTNAAIRFAADINLTDEQLNHPLVQNAERIVAEHAVLANDLLAYLDDKMPSTDEENIFTVLSNQYQLTYDQIRITLENKMKERERDFVRAGILVYSDPSLGPNAEVRRWISCLPYGMGGYLAWSQETTRFNVGQLEPVAPLPYAVEVVPECYTREACTSVERSLHLHLLLLMLVELARHGLKHILL